MRELIEAAHRSVDTLEREDLALLPNEWHALRMSLADAEPGLAPRDGMTVEPTAWLAWLVDAPEELRSTRAGYATCGADALYDHNLRTCFRSALLASHRWLERVPRRSWATEGFSLRYAFASADGLVWTRDAKRVVARRAWEAELVESPAMTAFEQRHAAFLRRACSPGYARQERELLIAYDPFLVDDWLAYRGIAGPRRAAGFTLPQLSRDDLYWFMARGAGACVTALVLGRLAARLGQPPEVTQAVGLWLVAERPDGRPAFEILAPATRAGIGPMVAIAAPDGVTDAVARAYLDHLVHAIGSEVDVADVSLVLAHEGEATAYEQVEVGLRDGGTPYQILAERPITMAQRALLGASIDGIGPKMRA